MIKSERIESFSQLGFGLFVHYGLYSVLGRGEWVKKLENIPDIEYSKLLKKFKVNKNWAERLCKTAFETGVKYIVLTARHHDGFSLFDTLGLNDFDAPHSAAKRDLIREFTDACRKYNIIPFLYHTLIDWTMEKRFSKFSDYMKYLRDSLEILLTKYGKIGGFWFDGMWEYPQNDWEEDALYSLIRKYQPDAMIVNNTGLSELGKVGHKEIDSVTFERGEIKGTAAGADGNRLASEMCQIFNQHWAYAENDINYKSVKEILGDYCACRKYNANFLLNIGPVADGSIRIMDGEFLKAIGKWVRSNNEALYLPKPYDAVKDSKDFVLKDGNNYYVFVHDVPMAANPNVAKFLKTSGEICLDITEPKAAIWLDNGEKVEYHCENERVFFIKKPFYYGTDFIVRVAKFTV